MNIALWVVQGLLAFAFVAAGTLKLLTPKPKLVEKGMGWANDYSDGQVKLIALAELLGGIGLVVPWATGILPVLTPIAAAALAVIMGGAVMAHVRRKEPPAVPIVLGLMVVFVAIGRFGILH